MASEQYPSGRPWRHPDFVGTTRDSWSQTPFPGDNPDGPNTEDEDRDAHLISHGCYTWDSLVHSYSSRSITHEEDKLLAISALAKNIQPVVHNYREESQYLAGLWGRFLPVQLLWYTSGNNKTTFRTKTYLAPSWSWASLCSQVLPYYPSRAYNQLYMTQILEAVTTTKTSNLMGQVTGGHICLRGWLKGFQTRPSDLRSE